MMELSYPPELPISGVRGEIAALIAEHQVVVIAGETGSGKSTQLPKICLELGRGQSGMIVHTQPRRIAARSIAERIATELGTEVGGVVGWRVRFTDRVGPRTAITVLTDGLLLAEIASDPLLSRYDTVIIDEAHERSLTVDFLLGYMKRLLPRRPDLKVIITSATIDPQRFSRHFSDAPVMEVSGRTYPVAVRYRPLVAAHEPAGGGENTRPESTSITQGHSAGEPIDQVTGICDAVIELAAEGPGDILVFLSGEREIRDAADAVRALAERVPSLRGTEVVPLYARLSAAEQHRVFAPHAGRRVVLATNVAETSLTVPGVRYVVDTGSARISRYSKRLKVQRLPIEPVSRASADQRAGRCGRVADGVCIRLYSEDDYVSRPQFTEPEILRTNLAAVILRMTALGLGEVADFAFLDAPDSRMIRDGVQLLDELGAVQPGDAARSRALTSVGRRLARLPVDPRLARMIVAGEREGCLDEVLVVTAGLTIQDPRERPAEAQQQADQAHARFRDRTSDVVGWLNLWRYLDERQKALSGNAFRRLCRQEYIHYLRVREWQDVHTQLRRTCRELGMARSSSVDADRLHRAVLAGLVSHIGLRDTATRDYLGARGVRFALWPGSAVVKKPPALVMAAELVETSRLWGRTVAGIEPSWVEDVAPQHLTRRTYSEPHWSGRRAAVMARERVTVYGVPVITDRLVQYARVDPVLSRELFIRHALVEGDWHTKHRFFHDNRAVLDDVEALEQRVRRRGLVVADEVLFDFYDARIPATVVSGRHFDTWWKKHRQENPDALALTADLVLADDAALTSAEEDFPTSWQVGDVTLPVTYQFEPGAHADGVTVHVPVAALMSLPPEPFGWQVPGLRLELVTQLIRGLPKALRRSLIPAPDRAEDVVARVSPADGPVLDIVAGALRDLTGTPVVAADFALDSLPPHLRVTFEVIAEDGRMLGAGTDLVVLRQQFAAAVRRTVAAAMNVEGGVTERTGLSDWTIGNLPDQVESVINGVAVQGFPALVDEGSTAGLRIYATEAEADFSHLAGVRSLLRASVPFSMPRLLKRLSTTTKLGLSRADHAPAAEVMADCLDAALDALIARHSPQSLPRNQMAFTGLRVKVVERLFDEVVGVVEQVEKIVTSGYAVRALITELTSPALLASHTDLMDQRAGLLRARFVTESGVARLGDLARYLAAMEVRIERLHAQPARDATLLMQVCELEQHYADVLAELPQGVTPPADLQQVWWMLQELRVSLFAPTIRTAYSVSPQRIQRALSRFCDQP
ncbi:MAG: ATP-dependent RNA helicase HrpA [Actinomycetota bacterium]